MENLNFEVPIIGVIHIELIPDLELIPKEDIRSGKIILGILKPVNIGKGKLGIFRVNLQTLSLHSIYDYLVPFEIPMSIIKNVKVYDPDMFERREINYVGFTEDEYIIKSLYKDLKNDNYFYFIKLLI